MTKEVIEITPSITVHKLLEDYPELEEVLIDLAPPFKKLKNPRLRKSVAKVATLKHISVVGRIPLDELIDTLRAAVDQPASDETYEDEAYFVEQPDWFSSDKIAASIEEAAVEDKDTMTVVTILREAKDVRVGEIIELVTTFIPAPGIDRMKALGYSAWVHKEDDGLIKTYFLKQTE